jgi:hypothetical protein
VTATFAAGALRTPEIALSGLAALSAGTGVALVAGATTAPAATVGAVLAIVPAIAGTVIVTGPLASSSRRSSSPIYDVPGIPYTTIAEFAFSVPAPPELTPMLCACVVLNHSPITTWPPAIADAAVSGPWAE